MLASADVHMYMWCCNVVNIHSMVDVIQSFVSIHTESARGLKTNVRENNYMGSLLCIIGK